MNDKMVTFVHVLALALPKSILSLGYMYTFRISVI